MSRNKLSSRASGFALLALAAALLLLAGLAGVRRTGAAMPAAPAQESGEAQGRKHRPVPGERVGHDERLASAKVILTPEGLVPRELEVPAGPVLLSFKKRVGVRKVELELRAEGRDDVVWRVSMPEQAWKNSEIIRLRPGRYTLSIAGEPEWVCRVSVTPPGRS